ncbi:hypothetical protein MYX78_07000, partial [Acidobacteria bacterium AH-259-G07]|nr:hypothetical protein [Acidobacteria bacterium AH-259-G07]
MPVSDKELNRLNGQLSHHMQIISKCTVPSKKYGHLLLASPRESRYPYIYPRDTSCAVQFFRRVAGSDHDYDAGPQAFELMQSMAHFIKDVASNSGQWGQRYNLEGEDKSIYKQEDNVAHGISILSNYLLTARRLEKEIDDLEGFLSCIDNALRYSLENFYHQELNLFHSTTAIHESSLEGGYTCWVNFSFLYAFSLVDEVDKTLDEKGIISRSHLNFRKHFLYSVSELFMSGQRYVRRIDPKGSMDMRPDFTLLSPFYYGFLHYKTELTNSVNFLEKQLCDPELGMIMRYLPFHDDFATHVHAGNGPWLQYTAILAQFHFWSGNTKRGDELLRTIDQYKNENGEIPEHLSTCKRFEEFMERQWKTGRDFEKEFDKPILLDDVEFDKILEEANNMSRSYEETGTRCMFRDDTRSEGGYIQFAIPLMWSHVEYGRALMLRA